ncbi:MAG: aminotransferase class V-fold PLP-dependent enzyme [Gemmatimonadota bacterium]|nr:aminotransferase class V-fold PLP-dependent enzyme [Gemmatimonadota bacterium]
MIGHDALFPDYDILHATEHALTEKLDTVRRASSSRRAVALAPSARWIEKLHNTRFDQPEELEGLIDWVIDGLDSSTVQTTHPGYLGLFNPAPTFAAECADRIASAFNPQICVYSHAPAAVEIELHVIREVALRVGLPCGSGGHFTSGGAEANSTAMLCALQAKCPDYGDKGLSEFTGQPSVYVSKESHLAWLKMAHAAGIGRKAVRLIKTDGHGRMDPVALQDAIKVDIQEGCMPILIAATAGTTNAGMVDPLVSCGDAARKHDMWFHVDAAWGGALIASDVHRGVLNGIERADSITIDAHKWFATTMGAGMFLTSRPDIPAQVFRIDASYMPLSEASKDFYVNSSQWSRRFVGLRMFLALGVAGWDGYAKHVARSIQLIDRFVGKLKQNGWSLMNASPMAVACMVPPEGQDVIQRYVDAVLEDGRFWLSQAVFEDRPVMRVCVTNGRTREEDIDALVEFLVSVSVE